MIYVLILMLVLKWNKYLFIKYAFNSSSKSFSNEYFKREKLLTGKEVTSIDC